MAVTDVSVVMPVYNAEATLYAAMESLLAQSGVSFEIIAVDDGSTDATPHILDEFGQRYDCIRVSHLPHRGIVSALNHGLGQTRGRYIARMDADDISLPQRLSAQCTYLDQHRNVGVLASRVQFGGNQEKAAGFAHTVEWMNSCLTHKQIFLSRFRETPLPHPSVMFRAALPQLFGAYREGPFPEDWELWLRWLDCGVHMEKLPETLLIWNDPPQRLTRTDEHYSDEACGALRAYWLAKHLFSSSPVNREIVVVGAGRIARKRAMPLLNYGIRIRAWIDIDPHKIGNIVAGIPVVGREDLKELKNCFIIVCLTAHGAAEEAASWLEEFGLHEGDNYLIV